MTDDLPTEPVITEAIAALLDDALVGTLAVTRKDGSPHLSCVYHHRDGDRILISTESKRLKAKAIERTGRATYAVRGDSKPFPAATLEGPARILRVDIAAITGVLFETIFGTPLDEPLTDEGLAAVDRVLIELVPDRAYGVSYL